MNSRVVWIPSLTGEQCPTCGAVLEQQAAEFQVMGRPDPVHQGTDRYRCPNGHGLPDDRP